MTAGDDDAAFVDALLRRTQQVLGDSRIHYLRVHHAGPPPTAEAGGSIPDPESGATSAGAHAAWVQTSELAAVLGELWAHAWLPDPPTVVGVRYVDTSGHLRAEVTAHSPSAVSAAVATALDRLLVRGFLPDDDASTPTVVRARRGDHDLVVDSSGTGVSITLSTDLDVDESTTLDALTELPTQLSLTSDGR